MIWPNQRLLDLLGIDRRGVASAVTTFKQSKTNSTHICYLSVGSVSPSTINFNGASNEFETFTHDRPHCADHYSRPFAKMERLGVNQPAPGPIAGVGLGYLTLGGGFYAARRCARPQKRKERSAGAYFRSRSGVKSRTTPASARQARSIQPRRLQYVGENLRRGHQAC